MDRRLGGVGRGGEYSKEKATRAKAKTNYVKQHFYSTFTVGVSLSNALELWSASLSTPLFRWLIPQLLELCLRQLKIGNQQTPCDRLPPLAVLAASIDLLDLIGHDWGSPLGRI